MGCGWRRRRHEKVKSLVVYYSRRGENLVDGTVQKLEVGHTELLATVIQKITGADLCRLEPKVDYSPNYYACIDQARQDIKKGIRPKLKNYPKNLKEYDIIYLGYPNYWGTMPVTIFSFLEQFDFSHKLIKPFCTHEGGGMGRSEKDLRKICPDAQIAQGFSCRGTEVKYELSAIKEWIQEI